MQKPEFYMDGMVPAHPGGLLVVLEKISND